MVNIYLKWNIGIYWCLWYEMYVVKIRVVENRSLNIKFIILFVNIENKSIYYVSNSNKLVYCIREREREY